MGISLRPLQGAEIARLSLRPSAAPCRSATRRDSLTPAGARALPNAVRVGATLRPQSGTRPATSTKLREPNVALVASRHSTARELLAALLNEPWRVSAFESSAEFFGSGSSFDVVIVDSLLDDGSGIDVVGYITLTYPYARTLMITESAGQHEVEGAMRAGAFATHHIAEPRIVLGSVWQAFLDSERAREHDRLVREQSSQAGYADIGKMTLWLSQEMQAPIDGMIASLRLLEALNLFSRASLDDADDAREAARALQAHLTDTEALLGECRGAAGRLQRLLRELVVLHRARECELLPVRLREVFDSALALLQRDRAHVHLRCDDEVATAALEPLVHVVSGVLAFAVRAARQSPSPSVVVEVMNEREAVAIVIRDNGPGLDRAALGRLFEPAQNTAAMARREENLALVAEIVRRIGGSIEARSAVGEGSMFRILLPAT